MVVVSITVSTGAATSVGVVTGAASVAGTGSTTVAALASAYCWVMRSATTESGK